MANHPTSNKQKKDEETGKLTTGPRAATPREAVDAILGSREEVIDLVTDFPDWIMMRERSLIDPLPTDLEVKTLCTLARVAINDGDRDSILTACLQLSFRSLELGALCSMLCLRAGGYDIEYPGLCGLKNLYPELLESTLLDAIKLGPATQLARRAFSLLLSTNSEKAKELAPHIRAHPDCSRGQASMCDLAETFDPPMRFEVTNPTLSSSQQKTVLRIFPIACKAIFSADMDVAAENIKKLGSETSLLAAPLLVVVARMEGERAQAAAREELRKIAPYVAEVLPASFNSFWTRKE